MVFHSSDTVLSNCDFSTHPCGLPLHTHLFAIRTRSDKETRTVQRTLACNQKNTALPPLGRKRIRPRTLRKQAFKKTKQRNNTTKRAFGNAKASRTLVFIYFMYLMSINPYNSSVISILTPLDLPTPSVNFV